METNAKHIAYLARRRRHRRRELSQQRSKSIFGTASLVIGIFVVVVVVAMVAASLAFLGVYNFYARDLPPASEIARIREQFETTLIYDRTGSTVLYQVLDPSGDRQSVPIGELPQDLINATIALEDRSFFENPGFDIFGIMRAVIFTLQGETVQGGSTITQQLVKNTLIAPEERTAIDSGRKIREIILASEISRLYSKNQILEWYLNTNFYGNLAYGVGTAAQVYFAKRAQDLTLGEAAMLAAIPQNPQLNPFDAPQESRVRQIVVLNSMVEAGYITQEQATQAASEPIVIQPRTERYGLIAPHFSIFARQQAEQLLDARGLDGDRLVLGGGLRIFTTLDLDLFYQAECVMRAHIERVAGGSPSAAPNTTHGQNCLAAQYLPKPLNFDYGVPRNVTNSASVIIRPETGEILAMVGSLDYYNNGIQGNFNVAAQGLRQPGSAFKPFVYLTAFATPNLDYTPAKMVLDVPTTFTRDGIPYTPKNEDDQFHGVMSVRAALANSYNIPAVRTISEVTPAQVILRARQLGINTLTRQPDDYGLALALGSGEVTLLDLTYAYTPFATLGSMAGTPIARAKPGYRQIDPVSILRIEDRDGNILWQYDDRRESFKRQQVLQDALAYLITDILADNAARIPAFGEGSALELSRPAAVKTGTTNDARDAWTIGYTPQIVTGVWVGNNDNSPMSEDISGSNAAAPIWQALMEYIHRRDNLEIKGWPRPESVIEATVCQWSGLLPTPDCPKTKDFFYVDDTVSTLPRQTDTFWRRYQINTRTGLRATAETPPELIAERVYFEFPPEAIQWARETGQPLPPTEYDSARANQEAIGIISTPSSLARVRGTVTLRGTLPTDRVVSYTLEFGAGINPERWFAIPLVDPLRRGENIVLGIWDTFNLDGLYTLRLGIVLNDQTFRTHTVQVAVDNQAPRVQLVSPIGGEAIAASTGVVVLAAEAIDTLEMQSVEFYWNGELIARDESAPFSAEWRIIQTGSQLFHVIAYDAAGNAARSETIEIIVTE